ncbi:MAG: bifunctional glutamate N-acetyltransferase/amino-acid acetyltransferase ArgJ [Thermodesulfobacteriota bacterium]
MRLDRISIPEGFEFSTAKAGFKYKDRDDLALVYSLEPAAGAGVFTRNRFQAAPVHIARDHLRNQSLRAIVANSGQANACTGEMGMQAGYKSLEIVAEKFNLGRQEILPASTGVIGEQMDLGLWESAVEDLYANKGKRSPLDAAKAITTTDKFPKLVWKSCYLGESRVKILGMAKGAGMICPNMATMLGFVFCDAQVSREDLQEILQDAVEKTLNKISVDGDTSTNDCVLALANGAGGGSVETGEHREILRETFVELLQELAYLIVQDAEGGTKVVRIRVENAASSSQAESAARTIGHSPLVKTAIHGLDPNWGRIVAALGRSEADFDPEKISVYLAGIVLFQDGQPVQADMDNLLAPYLRRDEISIQVDLAAGGQEYEFLTSDLSREYVGINAEYRS